MYRSPAPAMGPSFDEVEPETKAVKIAAPSRLAGGPPQVSLQLKASEPSVRRAAVPFGKMSRPFGAGATAAGNGTVVENFVPREITPVRQPEQMFRPVPQPITETAPEPFVAAETQSGVDSVPAVLPEVPKLASAPEWEFAPVQTESTDRFEDVAPAASEVSMVADAPAHFDAPSTFEMPTPVEAVSEPVAFEMLEPIEAVSEPITFETVEPVEAVGEPIAFETAEAVEAVSEPIAFETPAFFETVSEPVPHASGDFCGTRGRASRKFPDGNRTSCTRSTHPLSSSRVFNRCTHGRNYETRAGIPSDATARKGDCGSWRTPSFGRVSLFRASSYFHRTLSSAANNTSHHASTDPTNTRSNPNCSNDWGRSAASTSQRHAYRRSTHFLV